MDSRQRRTYSPIGVGNGGMGMDSRSESGMEGDKDGRIGICVVQAGALDPSRGIGMDRGWVGWHRRRIGKGGPPLARPFDSSLRVSGPAASGITLTLALSHQRERGQDPAPDSPRGLVV